MDINTSFHIVLQSYTLKLPLPSNTKTFFELVFLGINESFVGTNAKFVETSDKFLEPMAHLL